MIFNKLYWKNLSLKNCVPLPEYVPQAKQGFKTFIFFKHFNTPEQDSRVYLAENNRIIVCKNEKKKRKAERSIRDLCQTERSFPEIPAQPLWERCGLSARVQSALWLHEPIYSEQFHIVSDNPTRMFAICVQSWRRRFLVRESGEDFTSTV